MVPEPGRASRREDPGVGQGPAREGPYGDARGQAARLANHDGAVARLRRVPGRQQAQHSGGAAHPSLNPRPAPSPAPAALMATAKHLGIAVIGFLATSASISTPTLAVSLPPSEDTAKARLNGSPRHAELARVDVGGTPVRVWVVYPERKDGAPAVIVIHEIFGLTDWIRAVADQLAAEGFIAVAPDLLSGKGPAGGGTDAHPSRGDVTKAGSGLARGGGVARLDAVPAWGPAPPAADGKSASIGFCWGGSMRFAWAAAPPRLRAAR